MEEYKEKFIEYLEVHELKYVDRGNKVSCSCINPQHQDSSPSAFAKFEDDNIFYHCSVCGYHLNTKSLVDMLGGRVDNTVLFRSKMNKLFKEFKEKRELKVVTKKDNDWRANIFLPPKHKDFKQSYRGVSPKTFSKVNCFITPLDHYYKKRLIFPLYDYKGNLKGFDAVSTSKDIVPKVLRSKNCDTSSFFGFENLLGESLYGDYFKEKDTVFICEGLFSALSFIELGYQGVFNFGVGSIEDKLEVLYNKGIKQIILSADKDEAGWKLNSEMYHLLKKSFRVKFFKHPWKADEKSDSNDYLKKDELQELIDKSLSII